MSEQNWPIFFVVVWILQRGCVLRFADGAALCFFLLLIDAFVPTYNLVTEINNKNFR